MASAVLCLLAAACRAPTAEQAAFPAATAAGVFTTPVAGWPVTPAFQDITATSGLSFLHDNGMTGQLYFSEVMGAGVGLLDFDGDDDLDVYLVQGAPISPAGVPSEPAAAAPGQEASSDRLLRNDSTVQPDGHREIHLVDVTAASGLVANGYGMGVAVGDIDNDGDPDLYVTNWGPNQLWLNEGDGTFRDITAAGVDDPRWSVGAAFVDIDRDGWLDLYVANYVDYRLENHHPCYSTAGVPDYCSPKAYEPVPDRLLRNRGDGTFEDISDAAGITTVSGPGLGVVPGDFDDDGWPDIYVANDQAENFLWHNEEGARFTNQAPMGGVAVSGESRAQASMGVAAGDFDDDGDDDLFMTHLKNDSNTFYENTGAAVFQDRTTHLGLGAPSQQYTGFGAVPIDVENDGRQDLVVVNGEVIIDPDQAATGDPFPLKQTHLVFRNEGAAGFVDVTATSGAAFLEPSVGRGLAAGDLDNDGDSDLIMTNDNGPAKLLVNEVGSLNAWLGLRLVGSTGDRDMLGARVEVTAPDATTRGLDAASARLVRRVVVAGSYASSSDPRILFGLGSARGPADVAVRWPDGTNERWVGLATGRYHTLRQGDGTP